MVPLGINQTGCAEYYVSCYIILLTQTVITSYKILEKFLFVLLFTQLQNVSIVAIMMRVTTVIMLDKHFVKTNRSPKVMQALAMIYQIYDILYHWFSGPDWSVLIQHDMGHTTATSSWLVTQIFTSL